MNSVGLVGGLGPESTIDYYRRILKRWAEYDPSSSPSIIIDSLDVQQGLRMAAAPDHTELLEYLLASVQRLARAGVDFVALTANTAHLVFDELAARSPVPLLSIVEECARETKRLGLKRVALLGTRFTMSAPFYPEVCGRYGVEVVPPSPEDRIWIHDRYVGELLKGNFRDETRQQLIALVRRLHEEHRIDGVILGGTELPLLLATKTIADLPLLDSTELHVAAIVKKLTNDE